MQAQSGVRQEILRFACVLGMFAAPVISYGNPTGPEVIQGTATFNTTGNTLTVTPSGNAIIQWRNFSVAPGETVRFIQPSASSVVNRIPGSSPSVAGQVESNGTVLFLNGSTLSGRDSSRDLAGIVDSSGRLQSLPASRRAAPRDDGSRRAITLSGKRVFVIGAENVRRGPGRILLEPGRGASWAMSEFPMFGCMSNRPSRMPWIWIPSCHAVRRLACSTRCSRGRSRREAKPASPSWWRCRLRRTRLRSGW